MADKLKLLMGKPLSVDKESDLAVHQPKVNDIVDMGESKFNEIVLPFVLTTDLVFGEAENEEELIAQYHMFDLFFIELENGKTILDDLLGGNRAVDVLSDSLRYFFNVEDVRVLMNRRKLVINDSFLIDREQFDSIRKAVQAVVSRSDIEVEKPPRNMTKRQKDIWTKLQKGRRRSAEKNAVYLQDIINYVSFGGNSYIPIREIGDMTYFQLQNAYKSIIGKDAFTTGMGYKLSQKFEVKDEVKHWTDSLKIGK